MNIDIWVKKMFMRIILIALVSFMLFRCSERGKFENVKGHWVSLEYLKDKSFSTFDIIDSVLILNKSSLDYAELAFWPKDDLFEARYPFHEWPVAFQVYLHNDTLFQITPSDTIAFVRKDPDQLVKEELFGASLLSIELPGADKIETIELQRKSLIIPLYIGRLKKGHRFDYPLIEEDSVLIQVMDVLIESSEILSFMKVSQSMVDEPDRDKLLICLYADKNTPINFIELIQKEVRDFNNNLVVYRGYVDWRDRSFHYKEI